MMSTESDESKVWNHDCAWMCTSVIGIWQGWGMDVVLDGKMVRTWPPCIANWCNLSIQTLNLDVLKTAQSISLTRSRIPQNLCTRLQFPLVLEVPFYNPLLQVCWDFWSKWLSDVFKKFDVWWWASTTAPVMGLTNAIEADTSTKNIAGLEVQIKKKTCQPHFTNIKMRAVVNENITLRANNKCIISWEWEIETKI